MQNRSQIPPDETRQCPVENFLS